MHCFAPKPSSFVENALGLMEGYHSQRQKIRLHDWQSALKVLHAADMQEMRHLENARQSLLASVHVKN